MMTREFRDAWTAKLRSGEYKQGRSALQTEDGFFCCLGVALEVASIRPDCWTNNKFAIYKGFSGALPGSIQDQIGIDEYIHQECICRNDDLGQTFAQIADYIDTLPVAP